MAVALLALFVAMGGSAIAASHYLINSTRQINPKVLKKLRGDRGPRGLTGPAGAAGAQGVQGPQGPAGQSMTTLAPLPSGQSESGTFAAAAGYDNGAGANSGGWISAAITYVQPLAQPIAETNIVEVSAPEAAKAPCPGVGMAERGYLCLYDNLQSDVKPAYGYSNNTEFSTPSPGAVIYWKVKGAGEPFASGEYTVTAP
jgi:hypothetical protein